MRRSIPLAFAAALATISLAVPACRAQAVAWKDWNSGLAAAAAQKRPVLVDVYTDWCGWCKRMDRDVYARPDVRTYLARRFVTVRLNAESDQAVAYAGQRFTARTLASAFNVTGYPTTIFLKSGGEHLANVPGYLPPDRFLLLLRYIGDGHMDRGEDWNEYLKHAGAGATP